MQAKHPDILKRIRFSDVMKLFGENVQKIKCCPSHILYFHFPIVYFSEKI